METEPSRQIQLLAEASFQREGRVTWEPMSTITADHLKPADRLATRRLMTSDKKKTFILISNIVLTY